MEGVVNLEAGEPGEVTVRGPDFVDTVLEENSGDVGVMHHVAGSPTRDQRLPHGAEVRRAFSQQHERGRVHERLKLLQRGLQGGRPSARPREETLGLPVEGRARAARVGQDVAFEGDQRPSIRSRRASL